VIFSPYLIPSVALADPELTLDLPPHITAGTGMMRSRICRGLPREGLSPMCDAIAVAGAKLVWDNLPRVNHQSARYRGRSNMMMGRHDGRGGVQKGLGAVHSLAHPLSADVHAPWHRQRHLVARGSRFNRSAVPDRINISPGLFGEATLPSGS